MRFSTHWLAVVGHQLTPLAWAMGAIVGCAGYYLWPSEPPWLVLMALMGGAYVALVLVSERGKVLASFILGTMLFAVLAQAHMLGALGEVNWKDLATKPHWITGHVASVQPSAEGKRVTVELHGVTVYGLGNGLLPATEARVGAYASAMEGVPIGQAVATQVMLFPPESARAPDERDFRLYRVTHTGVLRGYVQGKIEPTILPPPPTTGGMWATWLDSLQTRIKAASQPYAEGVITALLVADTRVVPAELRTAYRNAGLSHLLAVSGLQLTLVGVGVYMAVRWLLTLWPSLALRINGKVWGAWVGLVAAVGYAAIAGAPVSVQRALMMVALLLVAVLLGRGRGLLRAWCIAVVGVLAVNPAAVMNAGFQLSFAAVGSLIVLGIAWGHPHSWWDKIVWLARSSVVAAWATAPIVAFQFGQLNAVGVAANMVAIPAMTPVTWLAFTGLLAMPFGMGEWFFAAASWGAAWVNALARMSAELPWSTVHVPWGVWPVLSFLAIAILGAIYSHMRGSAIVGAVVLLGLGVAVWAMPSAGKVLVMDSGNVAVWTEHPHVRVLWNDNDRFVTYWVEQGRWSMVEAIPSTCDSTGCAYGTPAGTVLKMFRPPSEEDCALASVIIAPRMGACPDHTMLWNKAATAVLTPDNLRITTPTCTRPWERAGKDCW